MSHAEHWTWPSLVQAVRRRDAMSLEEGLPRKSVRVTGGVHADIPETFSSGATGWTEHLVEIEEALSPPPEFALQRGPRAIVHEGKTVIHPVHGTVVLPTGAQAVGRSGARWETTRGRGPLAKAARGGRRGRSRTT